MRAALPALVAAIVLGAPTPRAQDDPAANAPPPNGPRRVDPGWHALVGARVMRGPGDVLDTATVVIRDGRITAVAAGLEPPAGARVHDCTGLTVHAAFVDAFVPVATPAIPPNATGAHWHADVMPQRNVTDGPGIEAKLAKELRELGFGAAAAYPSDGIFRGTGALLSLEELAEGARRRVLAPRLLQSVAFDRARDGYPGSLMGIIALIRQTLEDALGRRAVALHSAGALPTNDALAALRRSDVLLVECRNELDALRAARLPRQFDAARALQIVLVGSGFEFRRIDTIAATGLPIVLPLDLPRPPEVSTLEDENATSLRDLLTWEHAPSNAARLRRAGVTIALTTHRLEDRSSFHANLRRALDAGLAVDDALAALTTVPAELLGVADRLGTVAVGRIANLCVVAGEPFAADRELRAVFVNGVRHEVAPPKVDELTGTWEVQIPGAGVAIERLVIARDGSVELAVGERSATASRPHRAPRQLDLRFDGEPLGATGIWRLTALVTGARMAGVGSGPAGVRFAWSARRTGDAPAATDATGDEPAASTPTPPAGLAALPVPLGAFGRLQPPPGGDVVVRGATIWTSAAAGILPRATLIVRDGRIDWVGPDRDAPALPADALVIDGRGLHVTPGLIDCHSHTGIERGVNEGTQAVTAEVRIADVLDPDDISWYRQLAGGVTVAHQLHGSANPIGGQSQVVKLRWGVLDPEEMKLDGPLGGIKFALGENVKRSRSSGNTRYPNTRMGVEALLRDRFVAAREYRADRDAADPGDPRTWPRRDLELDALAEILRGERLVHCHSYRQDEILMLCRMAQEFGFRIGTFQHGLEGYKVADAIREAAIGASIFSDWWAYKYEVVDAIPENAAIMTRVGVVVSLNSDSDELARRLNDEAAKAVKYGDLDPADALRLVTINPAVQLAIDSRVGSLEPGKDADFAIWSGDPLSSFSRCLQTWIDGRRYWSEDEDREAEAVARAERARLVQAALTAPGPRAAGSGNGSAFRPGRCACEDLATEATR
ncbi:MAG: amidohydrolase family protein [Planctomycetes bacterium]|nr:amidohydrolase family protein [Planctomycetota bacterium]